MPFREEPIGQMRPEKPRPTRDDRNLLRVRSHVPLFLGGAENVGELFGMHLVCSPPQRVYLEIEKN
jgi:hypothetical protein